MHVSIFQELDWPHKGAPVRPTHWIEHFKPPNSMCPRLHVVFLVFLNILSRFLVLCQFRGLRIYFGARFFVPVSRVRRVPHTLPRAGHGQVETLTHQKWLLEFTSWNG